MDISAIAFHLHSKPTATLGVTLQSCNVLACQHFTCALGMFSIARVFIFIAVFNGKGRPWFPKHFCDLWPEIQLAACHRPHACPRACVWWKAAFSEHLSRPGPQVRGRQTPGMSAWRSRKVTAPKRRATNPVPACKSSWDLRASPKVSISTDLKASRSPALLGMHFESTVH